MITLCIPELSSEAYPWRTHALSLPSAIPPSMMCQDELLYLYWLASEVYTGAGEIVDAGCLRGGSTICLAAGLKNNRGLSGVARIHSYDLFEYQPHAMSNLFPGNTMHSGDSFLPQFRADIREFHDLVEVNPGDIIQNHWNGKPIEILFLDLLKSNEINNHVLREYFSCLIPQRSIIIQQDYFHFYCYWIHLTMEFLADYFQVIPSPRGGTLAFRLLKPIPRELLEMDFVRDLPMTEKIRLLDMAANAHEAVNRLQVMTAKAQMLGDLGDNKGALALVETIFHSPAWRTDHLLVELSVIIKLIRMKSKEVARSPVIRLIEEWADQLNSRTALRLAELSQQILPRPVMIWGAGPTGIKALHKLKIENISAKAFIDSDPVLLGTSNNALVVNPPGVLACYAAGEKPYVLISSHGVREISLQLEKFGYHYESDYVLCL